MDRFNLKTPVALIVFNRPKETKLVFDAIARARPKKLLVIGDGARPNKPGEAAAVEATRKIVDNVNWPCDVELNFSNVNLGCKNRVSSGLDWVFDRTEEAIILEDDCLPDVTFFNFCQELLDYYREDSRIGMISGDNFQFDKNEIQESYYFTKYTHIWGWASWSDRWKESYDVNLSKWPYVRDNNLTASLVGCPEEAEYWKNIFQKVHDNEIDTWDYQWAFANMLEGRVNIAPAINLVSNIGFGADATHTTYDSPLSEMATSAMRFPIKHPIGMLRNLNADKFESPKIKTKSRLTRLQEKLVRYSSRLT